MNAPLHELANEPAEVHAFANGVFVGFTAFPAVLEGERKVEPHYWQVGFLAGRIISGLVLIWLIS